MIRYLLNNRTIAINYGIIMDGQSNSLGIANIGDLPIAQKAEFQKAYIHFSNTFQKLSSGVNQIGDAYLPGSLQRHGAEIPLSYRFTQEYSDQTLYIVKCPSNGAPLKQNANYWDLNIASTGEGHTLLKNTISHAHQIMPDINYLAYIWQQGESDDDATAYLTDITNKINDIRQTIPDLPVIICRINSAFAITNRSIYDLQTNLPNLITNCYLIDCDNLPTIAAGNVHYNSAAYQTISDRIMPIIRSIISEKKYSKY